MILRPATPGDAPALAALLNRIIRAGGTTAHETTLSPEAFAEGFVTGPWVTTCLMAEDGGALGFQVLETHEGLPTAWRDIATFTNRRGVGRALFAETRKIALEQGVEAINATIRADNFGGLAYYAAMGFRDYRITRAKPLISGKRVDRISKVYRL